MKQPGVNIKKSSQYITGPAAILIVVISCFIFRNYLTYHAVALLLLLTVSIIALVHNIVPVLISAALSALLLNLFFIPPLYTLHIKTPEDLLMFLIYFIIAIFNGVFTFRIKREERKTRERASRRNTLKLYNTLFNSLSHELKTPISTIIGSTDLLREQELNPEHRQQLLEEINTAGCRLNQQVENLLSMSRLESGTLCLNSDWCDVNELLYQATAQYKNAATHKIIIKENLLLPLYKLDTGLIQQVLGNIVRNALLYTPAGSTVTLHATQAEEGCSITIADNGGGLPHNALYEVFDKFYRSPGTKAGGTGLGLSIAKGFVEAHGGKITAHNDNGAVFTITIPAETTYINKLKNE